MEKTLSLRAVTARYQTHDMASVDRNLAEALAKSDRKLVVLDDDPTGVQTVHDIYVYTDWTKESIEEGFENPSPIFFILTNSRGFTADQSRQMHIEIATRVAQVAREKHRDFLFISRGDSTLRGHYPLETETLRQTVEQYTGKAIDAEILFPFFLEGGRYTVDNVHYVADGDRLIPAGETEFAKDKTFGFSSSNLCKWIEEKSGGAFSAQSVTCITLDELRAHDFEGITRKLMSVTRFNKVVVNALDYGDVKVFTTALMHALAGNKSFIFRTAAAFTKVAGGICDKPLLSHEELINPSNKNGGIIIVGSHVKKTTQQLEALRQTRRDGSIAFLEFNQHLAMDDTAFEAEIARVIRATDECVASGRSVAVYTRRERFDLNSDNKEDELRLAMKISNALTGIVYSLKVRPNYIIAKGGITSSDVGTKGLGVKKALVLGQILKGIPVWLTGAESKFPNMPYIIFPGNVGDQNALLDVVNILQPSAEG